MQWNAAIDSQSDAQLMTSGHCSCYRPCISYWSIPSAASRTTLLMPPEVTGLV